MVSYYYDFLDLPSYNIGFVVICNGRLIIPKRISREFLFIGPSNRTLSSFYVVIYGTDWIIIQAMLTEGTGVYGYVACS